MLSHPKKSFPSTLEKLPVETGNIHANLSPKKPKPQCASTTEILKKKTKLFKNFQWEKISMNESQLKMTAQRGSIRAAFQQLLCWKKKNFLNLRFACRLFFVSIRFTLRPLWGGCVHPVSDFQHGRIHSDQLFGFLAAQGWGEDT